MDLVSVAVICQRIVTSRAALRQLCLLGAISCASRQDPVASAPAVPPVEPPVSDVPPPAAVLVPPTLEPAAPLLPPDPEAARMPPLADARPCKGGSVAATGESSRREALRDLPRLLDPVFDCPFPEQATRDGIDEARVTLRLSVARDGTVRRTDVLCDPGHGFAEAAKKCIAAAKFAPAIDEQGNRAEATLRFVVQFVR